MAEKFMKSKVIMKKTKETKQYSNTKNRILPKPRPKKIHRKRVALKMLKSEASKISVPYNIKTKSIANKK